jgi:hypothetical protein
MAKQTENKPSDQGISQTELIEILQNIQQDIREIKTKIDNLEHRVAWIESTYEEEAHQIWENMEQDELTPERNNTTSPDRESISDIRATQEALNESLNRVDNNMQRIFDYLGQPDAATVAANLRPPTNQ